MKRQCRRWCAAAVLALCGLSACGDLSPYACSTDDQCALGGAAGRCLGTPSSGLRYCAFRDATCASGLRFDTSGAPGVAGTCVASPADMAAALDEAAEAGTPDAAPVTCPCSDPSCEHRALVAPFPLARDPGSSAEETDVGLERDGNGFLQMPKLAAASGNYVWVSNTVGALRGTVSRYDATSVREVARYFATTCGSLKGGGPGDCDGQSGCCSLDDPARYAARRAHQPEPPHAAVSAMAGYPEEVQSDADGSALVGTYTGGAAVTRIAGDVSQCIDRNGNGRIDTSSDVNGDGVITIDCNKDGAPDSIASVQAVPCSNGKPQEFFGVDDECVLWTTNVGQPGHTFRAMALGFGASPSLPADAWLAEEAGDEAVYRLSGSTGKLVDDGKLPFGCYGYAATVDSSGIVWVASVSGVPLYWIDGHAMADSGAVRQPDMGGPRPESITLDRDQNVWMNDFGGGGVFRYTPKRGGAKSNLGMGRWIHVGPLGGAGGFVTDVGIAADARQASTYFVWVLDSLGNLFRVPGSGLSALARVPGDATVDGAHFPSVTALGTQFGGLVLGMDQSPFAVAADPPDVTRVTVDAQGGLTQPNLHGKAAPGMVCPAGDTCAVPEEGLGGFASVADGDNAGFVLRNFVRPRGVYTWIQPGCTDGSGHPAPTSWFQLSWQAFVPPGAGLSARARTGQTPTPDATWSDWSIASDVSPVDLTQALVQNGSGAAFLQVELSFLSTNGPTAVVRELDFDYRCP